jgi:hypothetical protein
MPPVKPQVQDPRRRLRELLAIPERDRADAIWDEIVQLEIELAPGNRAPSTQADAGHRQESGQRQEPRRQQEPGRRQERRPDQARRQEGASDAKPGKRFFSKRSKRGPGAPTKT